jgi:hypothetical protein
MRVVTMQCKKSMQGGWLITEYKFSVKQLSITIGALYSHSPAIFYPDVRLYLRIVRARIKRE